MKSKLAVIGIILGSLAASALANGVPELLARPAAEPEVIKVYNPPKAKSPYDIPTDSHLTIVGSLKGRPDVVNDMITVVQTSGYRCDSLSFAMYWDNELTLKCNNFRYIYTMKDVGGRFVVTPQ